MKIRSAEIFIALTLAGCGDLPTGGGVEESSAAFPEPAATPLGTNGATVTPSCLSDCDTGVWRSLLAEEMILPQPINIEGCSTLKSYPSVRGLTIEMLTRVDCSGLESLYLWSVNEHGELITQPVKFASCKLGGWFSDVRRVAGDDSVLTVWACKESSGYYSSSKYYSVRTEDASGVALNTVALGAVDRAGSGVQVAYDPSTAIWGVAFTGKLYRFKSTGLLSGTTTWSASGYSSYLKQLSVRDGVFQVMEGYSSYAYSNFCTRVTAGGTLLCENSRVYENSDSATAVVGSRHVLIQDGNEIKIGSDSQGNCALTGTARTFARHNDNHSLIRALQVEGTPYVASLSQVGENLFFNLLQLSPAMAHLTSLPLAGSNEWNVGTPEMFLLGERIFVTFSGSGGLRIMTLPKPGVPQ